MCSIYSEYILCNAFNIPFNIYNILMKFVQNKCNKSIVNLYNNDFLCNSVANNVLYMCSELLCPDGVLQP